MTVALISIDYINEIAHPEGKLSGKGYAQFIEKHGTFKKLNSVIEKFRDSGNLVIHVRVGFSQSYLEQPKSSPLFGKAHEFKALTNDTWATEFINEVGPKDGEYIINKKRVSAFFGTSLETCLKNNNVEEVYIAGVATDLAVEAAVRDAHDRDFKVNVLADCCAAASIEDHIIGLKTSAKLGRVIDDTSILNLL